MSDPDQYSDAETARRLNAAVKRSLEMKPMPRKSKAKPSRPKAATGKTDKSA